MQFKFSVEAGRKHEVSFRYSRLTNTVKIEVDGKLIKRDIFLLWIPGSRRYEFEVGSTERRDVVIDISIPRVGAKVANPEGSVYVDGNYAHSF